MEGVYFNLVIEGHFLSLNDIPILPLIEGLYKGVMTATELVETETEFQELCNSLFVSLVGRRRVKEYQ